MTSTGSFKPTSEKRQSASEECSPLLLYLSNVTMQKVKETILSRKRGSFSKIGRSRCHGMGVKGAVRAMATAEGCEQGPDSPGLWQMMVEIHKHVGGPGNQEAIREDNVSHVTPWGPRDMSSSSQPSPSPMGRARLGGNTGGPTI